MRRIGLFARRPVVGRVKTRLSPALPPALACELHRAMVLDAIAVLELAGADERRLYWDSPEAAEAFDLPGSLRPRFQHGGDLGERLSAAFDELLEDGAEAVVFGTDCPALGPAGLVSVFDAMSGADAALLPASDGGYVAIGLRRPIPAIFEGVPWGSADVVARTAERAREANLRLEVIGRALDDLDTPADLVRHTARQLGAYAIRSPALDRSLRDLGLLPPA